MALTLLSSLALGVSSCSSDPDLVFEHEQPQFPTRADAILIEAIMPTGTAASDAIYISGEFNGGDEVAVGDPRWLLEKAPAVDSKWGIYLYPGDFVQGKTLSDGYHFVSAAQGVERTVTNGDAIHTDNPGLGGRANVYVGKWAKAFMVDDVIQHDGYAIFIEDNTGWDDLAVYAWSDDNPELFGGWPGMRVTNTQTTNGVTYKYVDTGAANAGLTYNLIFNDNGAGKQFDGPAFTLDHDIYLRLTDGGYEEFEPGGAEIEHDGYAIYISDMSGWSDLAMYAWSNDLPELFGGWPGALPTGTQTINGVVYKYFDTGADNEGTVYNLIMNDNGGGKQFDLATVTLDRDYYFVIDGSKGTEVDPENPGGIDVPVTPDEPDEPVTPPAEVNVKLYVENNTGWAGFYIYAWGDAEIFGGWPGKAAEGTETVGGVTYSTWTIPQAGTFNLIFNDNAGTQYDAVTLTVTESDKAYYIKAAADGATLVTP